MRSKKENIIKKIEDIRLEIEYKLNEIDNLHHSHDPILNKSNMFGLGTLFLILGILLGIIAAPFFVEKNIHHNIANTIGMYLILYMSIALGLLSFLFFVTYPYVNGENKNKKKRKKKFNIYKVYFVICIISFLPCIIILSIIWLSINRSTNKISNLGFWILLLFVDLAIIYALIDKMAVIADYITNNIINCVNYKFMRELEEFPISLFISISLIKLSMDIINSVVLKLLRILGDSTIENRIRSDSRIKRPEEKIEYEKEDLKHDISFQKKTFWKFQLAILILFFIYVTFSPYGIFKYHQSDAINVITLFTLIMLYKDKLKEWR